MQIAAKDKWRRLNEFLRWMFFAPTPFAAMHWALATWVPWAFPLPFLPVLPPPPAWPSLICCLSLCLHPRIHQNRPPTPPHLHLIRTKIFFRTKMDKTISSSVLSMRTEIPPMFLSPIKLALVLFVKVFGIYLHPAWLNRLWELRGGLTFYHVF